MNREVLAEELRCAVDSYVVQTVDRVESHIESSGHGLNLASGLAGWTVLLIEANHAGLSGIDCIEAATDKLVDDFHTMTSNVSLLGGATGIAWLLQQLTAIDLSDFDAALIAMLQRTEPGDVPLGLASGLVGVGVYGLCHEDQSCGRDIGQLVVGHLRRSARSSISGTFWHREATFLPSRLQNKYPSGVVEFGLAHGIAGIVRFLAATLRQDSTNSELHELVQHSIRWIVNASGLNEDTTEPPCRVSSMNRSVSSSSTQLDWCTGRAGVALTMIEAGKLIGDADAERIGTQWALRAIDTGKIDTRSLSMCHGLAGDVLMLGALHEATEESAFHDAHLVAVERLLASTSVGKDSEPLTQSLGAIGIALALLHARSRSRTSWERTLLVASSEVPSSIEAGSDQFAGKSWA